MARALRIDYPGALYHVTCRGNEQRPIFRDKSDHLAFLRQIEISLETYSVLLHGYVLLTNHFHFIVEVPRGNLSQFMRHLNVSYTGYFNRRHHRVGHLYQGRFKAILLEADSYLQQLSRYVHLNPIRLKKYDRTLLKEKYRILKSHRWSSLLGYLKTSCRDRFMTYERVLDYMGGDNPEGRKAYAVFLQEGIRWGVEKPWEKVVGQVILGGESFLENLRSGISRRTDQERPSIRAIHRMKPEEVIKRVSHGLGRSSQRLCARGGGWERAVLMDCLYRYSGLSQREIGERMGGIRYSRVSRARKDLHLAVKNEPALKERIIQVERSLMSQ